jgi:preprotein translocase subunit SecD
VRANRWLILLIAGIAAVALFVDGFAFVYRFATHRSMTETLNEHPQLFGYQLFLHRGLDLQGGTRLELELDPVGVTAPEAQRRTVNIFERRVNGLGVSEAVVRTEGTNRILVELPGVNLDEARRVLGQTSHLTFWTWAPGKADPKDYSEIDVTNPANLPFPNYKPVPAKSGNDILDGKNIARADRGNDQTTGVPIVNFQLDSTGAKIFDDIARQAYKHPQGTPENAVAIFLDKDMISNPAIRSDAFGGHGQISGNFTAASAQELALQLTSGNIPARVSIIQSATVGATLGAQTVRVSLAAGLFGLIVVVLFMVSYYRLPGFVASLALLLYAGTVLAIFKVVGVGLTLAGLAGFILSVGMAVDANVLIFERLKEELRSGRTLGAAMDMGVRRAWPAIRDSNISTAITCLVLILLPQIIGIEAGLGLLKGFAITLLIGVAVSMFSAIVVTQTLLHVVAELRAFRSSPLYGV